MLLLIFVLSQLSMAVAAAKTTKAPNVQASSTAPVALQAQATSPAVPSTLTGVGLGVSAASTTVTTLNDQQVVTSTVNGGDVAHFHLPVTLSRGNIYVTLSTCSAPAAPGDGNNLQVFYSTSAANSQPGPASIQDAKSVTASLGYALATVPITSSDLWIGVAAPSTIPGAYGFQLGVSTSEFLHQVSNEQGIFLDDTDSTSALMHTLTYSSPTPNFQLYLTQSSIPGSLTNSVCAITTLNVVNASNAAVGETTRLGNNSIQYNYENLAQSTTYAAYLVKVAGSTPISSTAGGAAVLYPVMQFTTKTFANCRLVFNLQFCSQVAYSVPAPVTANNSFVQSTYDSAAQQLYQNFSLTLSNFNCNSSQYSLVRGCDDCANAYKDWLCAVSIPRCTDVNSQDLGVIRSPGQSRNPIIDSILQPDVYKEVLPCVGLCYNMVQSCPPLFAFSCPLPNTLTESYQHMVDASSRGPNGAICNAFGRDKAISQIGSAYLARPPLLLLGFILALHWR